MKKRIIAFIILVIMLAMVFSSCSLVRKNEERAANEILATVASDGITLTVSKNELLSYANYMLRQYSQYGYQPEMETFIPEILDYMINQKYLIIKGMVYLKSLDHRKDVMVANNMDIPATKPEGVLTLAERFKAIASVNKTFEEEIQGYIDEYEQEQRTRLIAEARREVEDYIENGFSVDKVELVEGSLKEEYLLNEDYDQSKIKIEIFLSKEDEEESVIMPVSSTMYDKDKAFTTELSSEEKSQKVVTKEIVVVFEEPITTADGETDYIIHKTPSVEYKIVVPRGTPEKEEEENELEGQVPDRYKALADIAEENIAEFFEHTPSRTLTIKEQEAYRQFRQAKRAMKINFDEEGLDYYYRNQFESQVLEAVRHELGLAAVEDLTNESLKQAVEQQFDVLVKKQKEEYSILTSSDDKVKKFSGSLKDGTMNLQKVYYVPLEALADEGYELKDFFAITHILFKFDEQQNSFIERDKGDRDEDELWLLRDKVAKYTKTSRSNPNYDPEFDCPKHKYNEGECIYEGDGLCPSLAFDPENLKEELFGENGIYKRISDELLAAAPKERLEIFKKYMALYNDDGGAMTSATGYLIPPEGIAHGYDGDDFPGLARKLFAENPEVGSAFLTDDNGNPYLGYAFTSYGIHLMMVSFIPFEDGAVDENGIIGIDTVLDSKGTTHRQLIKKELIENMKNKAYTDFTEEHNAEKANEAAVKNAKKMKNLLKELGIK